MRPKVARLYGFAFGVPEKLFNSSVEEYDLPVGFLAATSARTPAEVQDFMQATVRRRPVREASMDIALFEKVGILFDALDGEDASRSSPMTVAVPALRLGKRGLSAADYAMFRPKTSGGNIEMVVCLRGEESGGDMMLTVYRHQFELGADDGVRTPDRRDAKPRRKAFRLPVVSVSLSGRIAADLDVGQIFNTRGAH